MLVKALELEGVEYIFGVPDEENLDLPDRETDLQHTTDFRSVYATLLDRWLEADADTVLGQKFDRLGFL